MFYKGLHIIELLTSRKKSQGFQVFRIASDDYPVHLVPRSFATVEEAKQWVSSEYKPENIVHKLTKEDKTLLILK